MKKIIAFHILMVSCICLYAQDAPHENYPQWPADKPETGFIEDAQGKTRAEYYGLLPQEVAMQDRMRTIFVNMMQNASAKLGWQMMEISEYTNNNPMQGGSDIPYNSRSPRGIIITFQFIVNKDSLQAWKNYETGYENQHLARQGSDYSNIRSATESPLYKQYKDSADHYMKLYLQYTEAHKDEGAALYTKDKHPKYYQQKENEFINKMTSMADQTHANSGVEQMEDEQKRQTIRFKNHTVVQVVFSVNDYGYAFKNSHLGANIKSVSAPYPVRGARLSRLYRTEPVSDFPWHYSLLMALGNFLNKKDQYGTYLAGFSQNGQNDEHTPKKIKSDKVQTILVNIYGDKSNIEKMVKLIDMDKLNSTIEKQ